MKSINLIDKGIFSKGLLIPVFCGALLLLIVNTSCNKDKSIPAIDNNNNKTLMSTHWDGVEITVAPHSGDNTADIQAAIDAASADPDGGTVYLTDGTYNLNATTPINIKSNVTLSMTANTKLVKPASSNRYEIIRFGGVHNARVLNGQIIGDRDIHVGTSGEWGYGISIKACDSIRVVATKISKCWGDGIMVCGINGTRSTHITIKSVWCHDNRRQAISLFDVNGVEIDNCKLYSTSGTAPSDGIDIEPDRIDGQVLIAENINIHDSKIYSNGTTGVTGGNGIEINQKGDNIVRYVTINNNEIHDNKAFSAYFSAADHVTFTNNTLYGNGYNHPHSNYVTNYVESGNTYP